MKRIFIIVLKIIVIFSLSVNMSIKKEKIEEVKKEEELKESQIDKIWKCYQNGVVYYYKQDYGRACENFRKFLDKYPSNKRINMMFQDAFSKYQKIEVNFIQAKALIEDHFYSEAIPFLNEVLNVEPNNKDALNYLFECYKKIEITIKILDKPSITGNEIKDITISPDEELKFYAVGYDKNNSFIGPVRVKWHTTGTLNKIKNSGLSSSLNFSPVIANKKGTVKAVALKKNFTQTGKIKVTKSKLSYFKVQAILDLSEDEIEDITLKAGEKIRLYAHGFDKNDQYIGVIPVQWEATGVKKYFKKYISSFFYVSKKAGKGRLFIKAKNGKRKSIDISVLPGKVAYIQIEDSLKGKGQEVLFLRLKLGDKFVFYAAGYDKYFNFVDNVSVNWSTEPFLEPVKKYNSVKFEFSSELPYIRGKIVIEKEGISGDKTGFISIYPGDMYLTKEKKEVLIKKFEKENKIVYFVKPKDILSRIFYRYLTKFTNWQKIRKYFYAIGEYNNMPDINLVIVGQPIYIPFIKAGEKTTKSELADELFNNKNMKDKILIYNKRSETIQPDDKLIILDTDFLKTGDINYIKTKYYTD